MSDGDIQTSLISTEYMYNVIYVLLVLTAFNIHKSEALLSKHKSWCSYWLSSCRSMLRRQRISKCPCISKPRTLHLRLLSCIFIPGQGITVSLTSPVPTYYIHCSTTLGLNVSVCDSSSCHYYYCVMNMVFGCGLLVRQHKPSGNSGKPQRGYALFSNILKTKRFRWIDIATSLLEADWMVLSGGWDMSVQRKTILFFIADHVMV